MEMTALLRHSAECPPAIEPREDPSRQRVAQHSSKRPGVNLVSRQANILGICRIATIHFIDQAACNSEICGAQKLQTHVNCRVLQHMLMTQPWKLWLKCFHKFSRVAMSSPSSSHCIFLQAKVPRFLLGFREVSSKSALQSSCACKSFKESIWIGPAHLQGALSPSLSLQVWERPLAKFDAYWLTCFKISFFGLGEQ